MTRIRGAAWIMGAFVVGALTMLPLVTSSRSVLTWGFLVFLYAALAQSWNLLGGLAGQVSLGHAAFFGLGARLFPVAYRVSSFPFGVFEMSSSSRLL